MEENFLKLPIFATIEKPICGKRKPSIEECQSRKKNDEVKPNQVHKIRFTYEITLQDLLIQALRIDKKWNEFLGFWVNSVKRVIHRSGSPWNLRS